jgi:hypothetical protein
MTAHTDGYRAQAFEPRSLALFFLLTLALTWAKQALRFYGVLPASAGITIPNVLADFLAGWGPTIVAFLLTAFTLGRAGVNAL